MKKQNSLKCLFALTIVVFLLLAAYKHYLNSHIKSYKKRNEVSTRITEHCAQFSQEKKRTTTNNNVDNDYNSLSKKSFESASWTTRVGFFLIGD